MSHDAEYEEYERQESMQFRRSMGFPPIGPLTLEQSVTARKYEQYMLEQIEEHEAQDRAGGRTICPQCGERSVKHSTVLTLGYEGHPGAEYSGYAECEKCDYKEL
jgi:hypothetical protein